ncbi:hypothetical protein BE20_29640 [Sorangium cellulosum]|nr:hypothetical protein BE20_29640 [Sorangium cellulosum]
MSTPSTATTISIERGRHTPTRASGPTPRRRRRCASWFARRSSSPYAIDRPSWTTATADGASAARASKLRCRARGARSFAAAAAAPHASTRARSSGASRGSSDRRASGRAAAPASSRSRCPARRSIEASSNRSVSYSIAPARPPSSAAISSDRSSWAPPASRSTRRASSPGISGACRSAGCSAKSTWQSGAWERSRAGRSASTTWSNGTSWCAWTSRTVSFTRASSAANVGSPPRSVRSTTVLAKQPTSPSRSARLRFVTGVPTRMSSEPVTRARSALNPATSTA